MEELIQELITKIKELETQLKEQIENSGSPNPVLSGSLFPEFPYNNQIFCLINEKPPEGGTLYRYDNSTNTWLSLVV